jgi:holo-[acyl-carrier protein] synthase
VQRIQRLLDENPQALSSLFTEREQSYCLGKKRRYEHLAARFAAKEAVLKAFGTGLGQGMSWTDVEVINEVSGRPRVHLHGGAAALAQRRGLIELDVSLSHTAELAIAQVATVWGPETPDVAGPDRSAAPGPESDRGTEPEAGLT